MYQANHHLVDSKGRERIKLLGADPEYNRPEMKIFDESGKLVLAIDGSGLLFKKWDDETGEQIQNAELSAGGYAFNSFIQRSIPLILLDP